MKKALLCTLLLCTLSTNVAFANNDIPVVNSTKNVELESDNGPLILTREITLINQTEHCATDGYEKTFTCSPKNGNKLNIYVKNYSSQPMNFIVNGVSKTVEGNGQLTRSWSSSSGVSGDFKVKVTNDYGYKVDILVNARQFDK